MPSHTYKPNLTDLRNAAVLVESETRYTARGPKERTVLRQPSRSISPKKRQPKSTPLYEEPQILGESELLAQFHGIGFEPLKLPKTKVGATSAMKSWLITMQTQNDYLREWKQSKCTEYLQRIMVNEGHAETRRCTSCSIDGSWRCHDCLGCPIFCTRCCREHHTRQVFHRVQHWNGTYFEEAQLYRAGVVLHFGHGGSPCPARLDIGSVHIADNRPDWREPAFEDEESTHEEGQHQSIALEHIETEITIIDQF
jgi:hypothetical protein